MNKKTTQSQQKNLPAKVEHVKSCNKCGEEKPIGDFYFNNGPQSGRRNVCNKCRYKQRGVKNRLLKDARYRAKKKNLECTLTLDDIQIPEVCPVFKTPLIDGGKLNSPSLDRIDNTKGYTKDNIVVVSFKANHFKNSATIGELKQLVEFYEQLMSHK